MQRFSSFIGRKQFAIAVLFITSLLTHQAMGQGMMVNSYNGWSNANANGQANGNFGQVPSGNGFSFSQMSIGDGLVADNAGNGVSAKGWGAASKGSAISNKHHIAFQAEVNTPMVTLVINSLSLKIRKGGQGPDSASLQYSLDNSGVYFDIPVAGKNAIELAHGNNSTYTFTPQNAISVSSGHKVKFRIVAWGSTGNNDELTIKDGSSIAMTTNAIGTALPVELSSFSGAAGSFENTLSWKTAAEENISYFEVEKSTDAASFSSIGQVTARNSKTGAAYAFSDNGATAAYYRLKMVDANGTFTYSRTVAINRAAAAATTTATLQGNMVSSQVTVTFSATATETVNAFVFDMNGRIVAKTSFSVGAGTSTQQVDISSLPSGIYLVQLQGTTIRQTEKISKM